MFIDWPRPLKHSFHVFIFMVMDKQIDNRCVKNRRLFHLIFHMQKEKTRIEEKLKKNFSFTQGLRRCGHPITRASRPFTTTHINKIWRSARRESRTWRDSRNLFSSGNLNLFKKEIVFHTPPDSIGNQLEDRQLRPTHSGCNINFKVDVVRSWTNDKRICETLLRILEEKTTFTDFLSRALERSR